MGLHFALRSVGLESVENAARKFVSERQRKCFKSFKNASDRIDSLVMASKFHSIADLFVQFIILQSEGKRLLLKCRAKASKSRGYGFESCRVSFVFYPFLL